MTIKFAHIVARSINGVIGNNGDIPWKISRDLNFFKEKTTGKVVVMGRITYEDIGGDLKNRTNIVLSRKKIDNKNVITCKNYQELFEVLKKYNTDDIFVIGGEAVFEKLMPFCKKLYITKFNTKVSADRFLKIDINNFFEESISDPYIENNLTFRFITYVNNNICVKKNCSIKVMATCNKCKYDKQYGLIELPNITIDGLYRNLKNNKHYIVLDISNNQTNCKDQEIMVIYQNINGGKIYPRNIYEFDEKFEEIITDGGRK